MEQWNNVELTDLKKKSSYTLDHQYDGINAKNDVNIEIEQNANIVKINNQPEIGGGKDGGVEVTLQPGSDIKPKVNMDDVESLVRRLYGITTSEIKEMISYDDRNYFIKEDANIKNPLIVSHWPHGYVLKILNALDSKKTDFVDAQNQLMIYLSKQSIQCPKPIPNVYGKHYSVEHINGGEHVVRLLEFIPGKLFHEVPKTNYLLYQSGEYIAKIDRALKNFTHSAYDTHRSTWMLQSVPQLKDFIYVLQDHTRKAIIEEIIDSFETNVLPKLDNFEQQIIHGDYNEQNIIVARAQPGSGDDDTYKATGIIDFGDTNRSPLIFELGISIAYMMLQAKTLESGGIFLAGFTAIHPINSEEKQYLKYCVAARLAQSLVMGAYTYSLDPSNEYVLVTQEDGWQLIEQLWREQFTNVDEIWQTAADKYLTQSIK